jgi:hypothetical protein
MNQTLNLLIVFKDIKHSKSIEINLQSVKGSMNASWQEGK